MGGTIIYNLFYFHKKSKFAENHFITFNKKDL